MSELLTMQDLANGHLDIKALGEAANGDENTIVTTRTGNTYPSAERAINIMFQNGGLPATPFATKALMTASPLVDGKYAMVTNDAVNNGLYVKTAGAWVKSGYDPALQAKNMTNATVFGVGSNNFGYVDVSNPAPSDGSSAIKNPVVIGVAMPSATVVKSVHGRFSSGVTSIDVVEYQLVLGVFKAINQINVPVDLLKTEQVLPSKFVINMGNYLGYRCVGGMPRFWIGIISELPIYSVNTNGALDVLKSTPFTSATFQIYFNVEMAGVSSAIQQVKQESDATSRSLATLESSLFSQERIIGKNSPVSELGSTAASYAVAFATPVDAGELRSVDFAISAADSIRFMVIRELDTSTQSRTNYSIVWSSAYYDLDAGIHKIDLTQSGSGVRLRAGDLLAWQSVNKKVRFESKTALDSEKYHSINDGGNGTLYTTQGALGVATPQMRFTYKSIGTLGAKVLTQFEYDSLTNKDPNTLYMVV